MVISVKNNIIITDQNLWTVVLITEKLNLYNLEDKMAVKPDFNALLCTARICRLNNSLFINRVVITSYFNTKFFNLLF